MSAALTSTIFGVQQLIFLFQYVLWVTDACSLDVLETLHISETDREQLRNQQHLFHHHNE